MEDTTNAAARNRVVDTPNTDAATGLSRSAPNARPGRPRTRLRATRNAASTATNPRYQSRSRPPKGTPSTTSPGGSSAKAKLPRVRGSTERPWWPPVISGRPTSSWCPTKTNARVANPRYMPWSRPAMGLNRPPAIPASRTASTAAAQVGNPRPPGPAPGAPGSPEAQA
ncbi:hypothetical protein G443_001299 [Actinoalloteichus cyanogriseus DSM 43889]|uniref:Uncharacterized protein n=1 Tax=Actinoalloteichus caeruleus DSM 43889 TaxID=1120930 RepID=A0ABT1JEV4_ACTCY|nr:hypothetical protein [Actinoalloteichus caeruleus DSM 43889]